MRNRLMAAAAVGVFILFFWGSARSEGVLSDAGITVSGDVAYYSDYVWRGMLLDGDPVIQPGWYVSGPDWKAGRLTAKVWTSHDLSNRDHRKSEEYDYILDYTYAMKNISVSAGHTYYDFPEADLFSREWYAGIAFPTIFLSPSVFVYRDYGDQDDGGGMGTYTVINAAKSIPVSVWKTSASVEVSGHYGYNHELFINGTGADVGLTAGLKMALTESLTVMPNVNCSIPLGDLESKADGNQKERVYWGVLVQYSL